jgi:glycerol 3-phosphatase-2
VIVDRYDAFLFDLDGVLYRGSEPIPAAAEALEGIRRRGKRVAFMTNNSARTPDEVAAHLASVGVAAAVEEVETSALATARLLTDRGVGSAFVLGERGLTTALRDASIALVDDATAKEDAADAVVVGLDRGLTYDRLRDAAVLVAAGASFVASNADASFPAEDGVAWPGAGAIVAAIETTTGVRADVVGKPHAPLLRAALARAGGGVPLVIGDRLDTDIAGAAGLGWDSLLVLTGISTRADVDHQPTSLRPTYVAEDLRVLVADA